MKIQILSLICVTAFSLSYASDGSVTVKQNGTYTVGNDKKIKSSVNIDKGVNCDLGSKHKSNTQTIFLR